jgi:hypothetical protein
VLELTPTLAWATVLPFEQGLTSEGAHWFSGLWAAALILPLAYWGGRVYHDLAAACVMATIVGLGFTILPDLTHSARPTLTEWALVFFGMLVAWSIGHASRRFSADGQRPSFGT